MNPSPDRPVREQRRIAEGSIVGAILGGAPSLGVAFVVRGPRGGLEYGLEAVRAIGVLVPPGREGLVRGLASHAAISIGVGQIFGYCLPRHRSVAWGAVAGAVMGVVNVGIIGRRFSAIRALPLGPQIADNVAFGVVFAAVADR